MSWWKRSWRWVVALYTTPFRLDLAADMPLRQEEREQRQRSLLLRVILFSLFTLQQVLGIPLLVGAALTGAFSTAQTQGVLPIVLTQFAFAVLCVVCWFLNRARWRTLASLLFVYGIVGAALLASSFFGNGLSDQELFLLSFLAIFIIATGLLLPRRAIWVTTGVLIAGIGLSVLVEALRASAFHDTFHLSHLALRGPAVALLVLFYLFSGVVTWLFARSANANLELVQRARKQEQELAELKEQFLVTANHELRTPFMAMYGNIEFLSLLGDRASPQQITTRLGQALRAGEAVRKLLNAILEASLTSPGQFRIQARAFALAPLVRETLEQFDPRELGEPGLIGEQAGDRPVELHIAPELWVNADATRVRQVVANLLSNALKYSPPGSPIEVGAGRDDTEQQARIFVRDQGLGVPPTEAPRLFQRFVRLKRDQGGAVRGTGVGLYLCRVLVEAMGGTIWVESTGVAGEGSTFVFTLPLAAAMESAVPVAPNAGMKAASETTAR